ncbi:alanine-tRNA ligase [Babesia caballi]|uniref:Alanine-tRNA ligase n=1 Tax=Babesia caballi TaxID=5871 RepID=A0AAV4LMW7_BABCB|nr:alanine-tRNA ligase [Babesia caballi]
MTIESEDCTRLCTSSTVLSSSETLKVSGGVHGQRNPPMVVKVEDEALTAAERVAKWLGQQDLDSAAAGIEQFARCDRAAVGGPNALAQELPEHNQLELDRQGQLPLVAEHAGLHPLVGDAPEVGGEGLEKVVDLQVGVPAGPSRPKRLAVGEDGELRASPSGVPVSHVLRALEAVDVSPQEQLGEVWWEHVHQHPGVRDELLERRALGSGDGEVQHVEEGAIVQRLDAELLLDDIRVTPGGPSEEQQPGRC